MLSYYLINIIYNTKPSRDIEVENMLLLEEYENLLLKMYSEKVEILNKIKDFCEGERMRYDLLNIIIYRLRYIEKIKILFNGTLFQKVSYLFGINTSEYPELNLLCK